MDFELVRCSEGERWFPWNYGRRSSERRVGMRRFMPEPGFVVLNAITPSGRVLGSCSFRVGYRHSEYILGDEEYRYGALAAGPAYFWPDDESCPWILVLKSFWVRPSLRRKGIARRFAAYVRDLGLPAYLAFANKNVREWFDREFRPTKRLSPFQRKIAKAIRAADVRYMPEDDPDFTIFLQAEASALLLWESAHGDLYQAVNLDRVLLSPDRADVWAIDGGETFEAGFSDSAFAEDRCYGYVLGAWCDSWGPETEPFDDLETEAPDDEYETAKALYARRSCFAAGSIDGWVLDPDAICTYASVRCFLRTLTWREFHDVNDAVRELFIRDLRDEPRGLRCFSALVTPIDQSVG